MKTLIIIDQPPYGNWSGREALDMAFALAAFDQSVTLLFQGAGVGWLRRGQDPAGVQQKNVEKNLSAAPVFGVEGLLADELSLARFGLIDSLLLTGTTRVTVTPELLTQYDHVVNL